MNYLNKNAFNKISKFMLITENIFSIKAWESKHEKEIQSAIKHIQEEYKKILQNSEKNFSKNYKKDYEFLKENNFKFGRIINKFSEFKDLLEKLSKFDQDLTKINSKELYDYLIEMGAATYVLEIEDLNAIKHSYPFILIPKQTFFEKIFLKGDMLGFFTKPSWIQLEKEISILHEAIEIEEFSKKRFKLGGFYVKSEYGDFYKYGNHFSIFVLAKEAVVLNKYKKFEAIKALRDFRRRYEWQIIKEKSGVDFEHLKKLTPAIIKKLNNIKEDIIGDEKGLFIHTHKLKNINKNNSKRFSNIRKKNKKFFDKLKDFRSSKF